MAFVYTYFMSGMPEYVGKGSVSNRAHWRDRYFDHIMKAKPTPWGRRVAEALGTGVNIEIHVAYFKSDDAALIEERRLISLYGRRDRGEGSLYNRTNGGQGTPGSKRNPTSETRAKLSEAAQRRAPVSAETKALLSLQRRGKPKSPEWRAAMSAQRKAMFEDRAYRQKMHAAGWCCRSD